MATNIIPLLRTPSNDNFDGLPPSSPRRLRVRVEGLIERLVEMLDRIDGDPDEETDGDELDGSGAEDDFRLDDYPDRSGLLGPGCIISDSDCDLEEAA